MTTLGEDILDQIEETMVYGVDNNSIAKEKIMWMLQQVLSNMQEQVAKLKEEHIEKAMSIAFVYDERNLFDVYDIAGYLQVYVLEMELQ